MSVLGLIMYFLFVLLPFIGSQLMFMGGTFGKLYKVVVWPFIVGAMALLTGNPLIPSVLTAVLLGAAHTLPYGEKFDKYGAPVAWLIRTAVAASYGLAFYPLTHSLLVPVITVLAFIPTYIISRRNNDYSWPAVSAGVGAAEGAILLHFIMVRTMLMMIGIG